MSPFADKVVPVFQDRSRVQAENSGSLDNLLPEDLARVRGADVFIEGWPGPLLIPGTREMNPGFLYMPQSIQLGVPYYEILASRSRLVVARDSQAEAADLIGWSDESRYIGINFDKYGVDALRGYFPWLRPFLLHLVEDTRVKILNLFSQRMDVPHYPEDL
jgi:hypothetical protein